MSSHISCIRWELDDKMISLKLRLSAAADALPEPESQTIYTQY